MIREVIASPEYLQLTAVRSGEMIKRYEVFPLDPNGFYRISLDRVEKGKIYFPGSWELEKILKDIRKIDAE